MELLKNRYEGGFRSAQPVLSRFGSDARLAALVASLRSEGWLDWQIVGAFAPAAVSMYANDLARHGASPDAVRRALQDGMSKARNGEYRPPDQWTEEFAETVRHTLTVNLLSALSAWELDMHHGTPDMEGLRRFLAERFRHFSDDLPIDDRPRFPFEDATKAPSANKE